MKKIKLGIFLLVIQLVALIGSLIGGDNFLEGNLFQVLGYLSPTIIGIYLIISAKAETVHNPSKQDSTSSIESIKKSIRNLSDDDMSPEGKEEIIRLIDTFHNLTK